jgi:hypothetical protein
MKGHDVQVCDAVPPVIARFWKGFHLGKHTAKVINLTYFY